MWTEAKRTGDFKATITLDRELPPFGSEIAVVGDEGRAFIAALIEKN
jgi:hypothetical protein